MRYINWGFAFVFRINSSLLSLLCVSYFTKIVVVSVFSDDTFSALYSVNYIATGKYTKMNY